MVLFINPATRASGVHTAPPQGRHGKNIKKIFLLETTRPRAFIFCVKQRIEVLFINHANCGPWVHTGTALGASLSAIGLQLKIHEKTFFLETTTAKASIFGMQHSYVELYINPAKHAPGVRNGPTLGVNNSLRLTIGKTKKKSSSLKPYGPELLYVVWTNV